MDKFHYSQQKVSPLEKGFALLVTLVVVSVVLAIGLSLLFVTTRQYVLAVMANESEKAFQASQIGLECLRYWRNQPDVVSQFLRDQSYPDPIECAGVSSSVIESSGTPFSGGHWLYYYLYRFNLAGDRCVEPAIYIADMRNYTGSEDELIIPISNEGLSSIRCAAGTVCTAIFARGFNRPCNQLDSIYAIQREITIQF